MAQIRFNMLIEGDFRSITLTKTQRDCLGRAAEIMNGIAHVESIARIPAEALEHYAARGIISSNGTPDEMAAADAAETVSQQSPGSFIPVPKDR